jgi:lipopolysaccharide/colanic/teichoic acid biosynthesis glycosyltransferase
MKISPYVASWEKRTFDLVMSLVFCLLGSPLFFAIALLVLITEGWPVLFVQKRVGKDGRVFDIYKFRTMYVGADDDQNKYRSSNEADGPVFKIREDPRFVGIGKCLSHVGLDELPQLCNVIKGDMSLVGPRPLPFHEYEKVTKTYPWRTLINPGIVSSWVLNGSHALSFQAWMGLDRKYIQFGNFADDVQLIIIVAINQLQTIVRISRVYRNNQ